MDWQIAMQRAEEWIRMKLLLFGGTKIPELMKGLGKGYKIFKDEVDNIEKNIK